MKLSRELFPDVVEAVKPETEPYRVWDSCVPQLFVRIQQRAKARQAGTDRSAAGSRMLG